VSKNEELNGGNGREAENWQGCSEITCGNYMDYQKV